MIREVPQPVKEKGTKNFECPFYEQCLSSAAKRRWQHWSCGECRNHKLIPVYRRLRYIEDYYGVIADIYPEFRDKYERFMEPHASAEV
jgi:transcription elongation factor Elf1